MLNSFSGADVVVGAPPPSPGLRDEALISIWRRRSPRSALDGWPTSASSSGPKNRTSSSREQKQQLEHEAALEAEVREKRRLPLALFVLFDEWLCTLTFGFALKLLLVIWHWQQLYFVWMNSWKESRAFRAPSARMNVDPNLRENAVNKEKVQFNRL